MSQLHVEPNPGTVTIDVTPGPNPFRCWANISPDRLAWDEVDELPVAVWAERFDGAFTGGVGFRLTLPKDRLNAIAPGQHLYVSVMGVDGRVQRVHSGHVQVHPA